MAATLAQRGVTRVTTVGIDTDPEKTRKVNAGQPPVDDCATPANAPSLHEFEYIEDPAVLQHRGEIKLAVICCAWPQYHSVRFAPGTKVFTPWKL